MDENGYVEESDSHPSVLDLSGGEKKINKKKIVHISP